jgi:hypothetical protein
VNRSSSADRVDWGCAEIIRSGPERDGTELSEHDCVHWRVHESRFDAAGGLTNLNKAILAFLDLVGARGSAYQPERSMLTRFV